MKIDLSVVVPVYDEQEVLLAFHHRLAAALESTGLAWEVLYVNDGSRDASWVLLEELHRRDPRVSAISLSRNFGHQVAITAGIEHATGDAVVVIDADLQDPPELIPAMIARWREGFDVVYAVRNEREAESAFKRWTAAAFYRLMQRLTAIHVPVDAGDYRLMSRRVVDALNRLPERNRYVRGLVAWLGFEQTGVTYNREARRAGQTKYPLRRMVRLASDAIVSFSTMPLQLAIALGFALSLACFAYAGWAAWGRLVNDQPVPGWTSLMVAVLLVGGVQLMCLGIIGEYIGRIYDEVKQRPLYVIGEVRRARAADVRVSVKG